jgi:hypothetical protein
MKIYPPASALRPLHVLLALVGMLLHTSCGSDPKQLADTAKMNAQGHVTLTFAAAPTAEQPAMLRILAGPLPRGAKLVVTAPDGTQVALIRPYGTHPVEGTSYIFPLAKGLLKNQQITLQLRIQEAGATAQRVPTGTEVLAIMGFNQEDARARVPIR